MTQRHGEAASLLLVLSGWMTDPMWHSMRCLPSPYTVLSIPWHNSPAQLQSKSPFYPSINDMENTWKKAAETDNIGTKIRPCCTAPGAFPSLLSLLPVAAERQCWLSTWLGGEIAGKAVQHPSGCVCKDAVRWLDHEGSDLTDRLISFDGSF